MPGFTAIQLEVVHCSCMYTGLVSRWGVRGNEPRYKITKIYLGSLSFIFSSSYVGAGKEAKWLGRYDSHIRLPCMFAWPRDVPYVQE